MTQMLRKGSSGPAVRELQGNLRALGHGTRVDGSFGPETEKAVRAFQASSRLPVDGVVGPRTRNALLGAKTPRIGNDPFDPADLARWLSGLGRQASDWWNGSGEPAPAAQAQPRPGRAAPSQASRPATGSRGAPPVVSPGQNRQFSRLSFPGYEGRAWLLKDFNRFRGMQVQLLPNKVVRQFAATPKLRNECAQFVQLFGVPNTRSWRRGPQVCHLAPGELPVGTVVATLRDGRYFSDYSGRSHVGIYLGHDDFGEYRRTGSKTAGVTLLDQYNGVRIDRRVKAYAADANAQGAKSKKAWVDSAGHRQTNRVSWVKDGEEYFVLMTA
jgi:peptidoglycan hydrolase-like protein with peptidoglycan-binding domain